MPVAVTPLPSPAAGHDGAPAAPAVTAAADTPRHGRRAGGIAVRPEEQAWYAALLADHERLYAPVDAAEACLVEQLCLVELKLARLDRLELAALDAAADDPTRPPPGLAALVRYRARIAKERWELEHRLAQLAGRRQAQSADPATAGAALQDRARIRALGSLALLGLAAGHRPSGTNEPEAVEAARAEEADPAAPIPLNRQQRRRLERLRRQER